MTPEHWGWLFCTSFVVFAMGFGIYLDKRGDL